MARQDLYEALLQQLPPIIARSHIDRYFGGLVSKGYLQNLDGEGKGPRRIKTRDGGKVAYLRDDLVDWLERRSTVVPGVHAEGENPVIEP